jgi:dTDP-4-dehydrorhamnose reductase
MLPWLVTGAGGQVGSVLLRQLAQLGVDAVGTVSPWGPRPPGVRTEAIDLLDAGGVAQLIDRLAPERLVHAAAFTHVANAHRDPRLAERVNVEITRTLATLAARHDRRFVFLSTDMVFDGEQAPYAEDDAPQPGTVYGRTKLAAERAALATPGANAVVIRVPLLYGLPAVERPTTFRSLVDALHARKPVQLFEDEVRTPLWLEDAARAVRCVTDSEVTGILHAAGPEPLSRLRMGELLAAALGIRDPQLEPTSRLSARDAEPRPRDLSLTSRRYCARFGVPPGLPMAEALALAFAR